MNKAINRILDQSMTVGDLIDALQSCPREARVLVESATHDYWRTMIAKPIKDVNEIQVKYNGYHSALQEDEGDDGAEQKEEPIEAILIQIQ